MKLSFVKNYNKIIRIIFSIGLFLLPLIFWLNYPIPYEIPRVIFFRVWAEILLALGILSQFIIPSKPFQDKKFLYILLSFLGIAVLASFFGANFPKSLWGNYYRQDGLFTLLHLISFSLIICLFWKPDWIKSIALSITGGSFVTSLWLVFSALKLHLLHDLSVPNWNGAIGVSFGQPNFAGGYLLVTLPFIYHLYQKSETARAKAVYILVFLLQITAICFTRSLASILGIFILLFLLFLLFKNVKNKTVWFVSFILLLLSTVTIYGYVNRNSGFMPEGRPRIMTKVLLGALQRPILGWGFANVDYAFKEVPYPMFFQSDIYLDKAHSVLLETFATCGLLGLTIYLTLIVYILRKLFRSSFNPENPLKYWSRTLLMVFLLFLFHSQTNVISIGEEVIFWLVAGITGSHRA